MIKRFMDWIKLLIHKRKMKKRLEELRKNDPYIY